jgi:hypothetical protein
MNFPKTLFLGTAALLLGLGAGQAAEIHGETQPARQARACSQYGSGFRYVPESGICMKIGGWLRSGVSGGSAGAGAINWGALNGSANDRATSDIGLPTSGDITTDIRKRTGYGPVRAYISVGVNHQ